MDRRNFLIGLGAVAAPAIVPIHHLMAMPRRRLYVPKPGEQFVEVMHEGRIVHRGPCSINHPVLNGFDFDPPSGITEISQHGFAYADGYLSGVSIGVASTPDNFWRRIEFDEPVQVRKGDMVTIKVDRA
jgi:hypothetical protein